MPVTLALPSAFTSPVPNASPTLVWSTALPDTVSPASSLRSSISATVWAWSIWAASKSETKFTSKLKPKKENLSSAAQKSYSTATDLADWLVSNLNIPFREAHKITGNIVRYCEKKKIKLSELTIKELKSFNKKINDDIFNVLDAEQSVNQKKSFGSTSPLMVKKSAAKWIKKLQNEKK